MIQLISLLTTAVIGAGAGADQWKTVGDSSKSTSQYAYSVSFPVFNDTSVPAYRQINAQLQQTIAESGCDIVGIEPGKYMNYSAQAAVVAVNRRYVGVSIDQDNDCGGAHANYGISYLTYDSQTGARLDIAQEFGFYDSNRPEADEALRMQLAEILVGHIPAEAYANCFEGLSRAEKIESLMAYFPVVDGLAKNKTVVLGLAPGHLFAACEFHARVSLSEIKHMLVPGSYLFTWLK